VAEELRSYTGAYLKPLLRGAEAPPAPKKKARAKAVVREREAAE
jgi:hypothetical protein